MCEEEDLTPDECKFKKFIEYYSVYKKPAYLISKSEDGRYLLNNKKGKNQFLMYDLDGICGSCSIFRQGEIPFKPKTTDALWFKKDKQNGLFYLYLIEFKGDKLYNKSNKCELVKYLKAIEKRKKESGFDDYVKMDEMTVKRIVEKYSDNMLNGLAMKPLETITVALPLIYKDYCLKNPDKKTFDIASFLRDCEIVYRLVSLPLDNGGGETNGFKDHLLSLSDGAAEPDECSEVGMEIDDEELLKSYKSSLETYYTRYAEANIISDNKNFITSDTFNNYIETELKKKT